MSKKWYLIIGIGAGVIASVLALGILFIIVFETPSRWESTPLWMASPNCTIILNTKPKGLLPPTEYEYTLSFLLDSMLVDLDIPDDSSGGDPLVIYVLESHIGNSAPVDIVLIVLRGHAVVLDPGTYRTCSFDTYRDHLEVPADNDFIAGMVANAWKIPFSVVRWRYVATFGRTRKTGWAVGHSEDWPIHGKN